MTRVRLRLLASLFATSLLVAGCQPAAEPGADAQSENEFPRAETVFTTGAEWGTYSNWNPLHSGGHATYLRQGIYESLFVFDPWTTELEPWLAEEGEWVSEDEYVLTLRDGVRWHDGEALTADDVVFTVNLRNAPGVPYSALDNWLDDAVAEDDLTVRFTFSDPRAGEWDNWLYNHPVLPEHLWSDIPPEDLMAVSGDDRIVGTGPFKYHSHTEDRAVYERNDDWWATDQLGLEIQPRYVVDLRNQSNEVVVPQLLRGEIDLSNNFIPGVQFLEGFGDTITTFYAEDPYMIPANTAYLIPNHTRPPMDDVAFRRAMAFSINVQEVVDGVYHNIVQPAHNTGLLDIWSEFFDQEVVAEHGFRYDPRAARQILADAGYVDTNGDGFVERPDGEEIALTLIVPAGWTDWNEAAEVIAASLRDVGINVVTDFPDSPELDDLRDTGEFDLVINNDSGLSNTPAEHYTYLFQLPIQERQSARNNMARYENEQAWELTEQLWRVSVGESGFQELMSQLQEISLVEMPAIPLWYNGLWSQVNNSTWTNWPSSGSGTSDYYPSTWGGIGQLKAYLMFTQIQPAG